MRLRSNRILWSAFYAVILTASIVSGVLASNFPGGGGGGGGGIENWTRTGTTLSPTTAGDNVSVPGVGANSEKYGARASAAGAGGTAVGNLAVSDGANSSAIGYSSTVPATATSSIAIGAFASVGAASNNNVVIGNSATATSTSNEIIGSSAADNGFFAVTVIGANALPRASNQFVCGSSSGARSDVYFGKGVSNATPTAYTIHGTGGLGAGIAGANLNLAGGTSGDAATAGGAIALQVSKAGSGTSSSTVWTLDNAGFLNASGSSGITFNGASGIVNGIAWGAPDSNGSSGIQLLGPSTATFGIKSGSNQNVSITAANGATGGTVIIGAGAANSGLSTGLASGATFSPGQAAGNGGAVSLTGGGVQAASNGASGGAVNLTGGSCAGANANNGGSINLTPGAPSGAGTAGNVVLNDSGSVARLTVTSTNVTIAPSATTTIASVTSHAFVVGTPIGRRGVSFSLDATTDFYPVDASGGNITATVPLAISNPGIEFTVKKIDSSANTVTVTRTNTDTIDGQTTYVLSTQNQSVTIKSEGSNNVWWIK